nr:tetratricopeptide repeat protein [Lachnospiraceae bacterium]
FKMLEENSDDPYLYFQLGQSFSSIKDYESAYEYFGKGLEFEVDERLSYVQQMVVGYGYAMLETGREEEALSFEGIYETFCSSADFLCLMGHIYMKNGLFEKSYSEFEKATHQKTADVEGSNSFLAYYNMAIMDEAMGNIDKAVSLYKKCGEFAPAKERLGSIGS